jgi:hypothetical protein
MARSHSRGDLTAAPPHADNLSAAPYIQENLGIGEYIREVQEVFGKVFNEGTEFRRNGSQFDWLPMWPCKNAFWMGEDRR